MGKMAGAMALWALWPSFLCLCNWRLARVWMLESKSLTDAFGAFCLRFQGLARQSWLPEQELPSPASIKNCAKILNFKIFLEYGSSFYWKLAIINDTYFLWGSWTILWRRAELTMSARSAIESSFMRTKNTTFLQICFGTVQLEVQKNFHVT